MKRQTSPSNASTVHADHGDDAGQDGYVTVASHWPGLAAIRLHKSSRCARFSQAVPVR